jgi:hypothetical protein
MWKASDGCSKALLMVEDLTSTTPHRRPWAVLRYTPMKLHI